MHDLVTTSYAHLLRAASVFVPANSKLTKRRSRLLRDRGDVVGALTLIERALVAAPEEKRLLEEQMRLVRQLVKVVRAGRIADGILVLLDRAVDDPKLIAMKAAALHDMARHQEALDAWRTLAEQAPLEPRAWAGMAKALYAMDRPGRIDSLIEEYLQVLGMRPERHVRAACVARAGHRSATFEALLAQAQEAAETDDQSRAELAALHVQVGRLGDALNCFDGVPAIADHLAAKRQKALSALRLVGIDAEDMSPTERADLRMPDLALLTLIRRAPPQPLAADARRVVMVYTSMGPGGAERQLANTVRGLCAARTGHHLVLMPTKDKDPEIDRFHQTGLAMLPITIDPCAASTIDVARLQSALGPDAGDLLALLPGGLRHQVGVLTCRLLHTRPQVVHAWGDHRSITAGMAAAIVGVPRVVLSGRTIATPGSRAVPGYFRTVYRALLNRPGTVLLNNSEVGAQSYAEWLDVDPSRIGVIHNGVDLEALEGARDAQATAAHRARLGLPPEARIVGTAFRLGGVKRPLLWVQAAAEVARRDPNVHFVIVGDGPLREDVQSLAGQLGIADRLHMPGLTRQVVPWFELMDVVLLTSEREGTSNTALEAQALGIPVVSTGVGGMPETMVPGVSGLLVEADPAPEAVAEAVLRTLTDQDWRARARPAGQAFIRERFSLERMIRDTLQVYDLAPPDRAVEPSSDRPRRHQPDGEGQAGRVPETIDQVRGQS